MSDEAKALVERLRWGAWYYEDPFDGKAYASDDPLEAADLIETQAREIERLRERLAEAYQIAGHIAVEYDGNGKIERLLDLLAGINLGDDHDL